MNTDFHERQEAPGLKLEASAVHVYVTAWEKLEECERWIALSTAVGQIIGYTCLYEGIDRLLSFRNSSPSPAALIAIWLILTFSPVIVYVLYRQGFLCPRCRQPFFSGVGVRSRAQQACAHCGLKRGEVPEEILKRL